MPLSPPYLLVLEFATAEKHGIVPEALRMDIDESHGSKIQRGEGAKGGADVNHRPTHSSAASLLPCISTLSVGLISYIRLFS